MNTVGWGFDAHRFGGDGPVLFAGIVADDRRGLVGTSDGDVVAHAVADSLLGAATLDDIGVHFPSDRVQQGSDSMELLKVVVSRCSRAGLTVRHLDVTVIAQTVRVSQIRRQIRHSLAVALGVDDAAVSVKATTTDGMGFTGRDEGVAATSVVIGELAR